MSFAALFNRLPATQRWLLVACVASCLFSAVYFVTCAEWLGVLSVAVLACAFVWESFASERRLMLCEQQAGAGALAFTQLPSSPASPPPASPSDDEALASLRAMNSRLRAIFNATRDGVLVLDREGRLLECNWAAERLLGIEKDEMIDQPFITMLVRLMDSDELSGIGYSRSQLTALVRQLRLEPERITHRQFARQISPERTIHIEEIGSPVRDERDRIIGRLLVLRDITEQKQLEEFRDQSLHMIVHDLRGPLSAIISGLSFALDEVQMLQDSEVVEKTVQLSLESAHSLLRLVESILDTSRLEKREMPVHPGAVDLYSLAQDVQKALAGTSATARIAIDLDIAPDLPLVWADYDILRRVLINLVDNALRHTPSGERILIQARQSDVTPNGLTVRVADSGRGIPPEEYERIFERYRQIKDHMPLRGSKGSGLGLTFCKLAVEAHGGRIWVDPDSPLPGACFAIRLPIAS